MEGNSTIFLLLTVFAALGRFATFALDPQVIGVRKDDHAVKLIGIDYEDKDDTRVGFVVLSLSILRRYINSNLGTSFCSLEKLWRVAAMSAFIILGVFVTSHAVSETAWRLPSEQGNLPALTWGTRVVGIALSLTALIAFNTLADLISIALVRHFIEPAGKLPLNAPAQARFVRRLIFLPLYGLAIYVLFVSTMNAAFSAIITIRGVMAGYPFIESFQLFLDVQKNIFWSETGPRFIDPIGRGASIAVGNTNLLVFCITPLLPAAFLIFTVITGSLLEVVDRISNGQVAAALPSSERPTRNPLIVSAVVLSVLGAIATLVLSLK